MSKHTRHFVTLSLFFCLACESKPIKSADHAASTGREGAPTQGKATREDSIGLGGGMEMQAELESGPASSEQLVLGSESFLDCLRAGVGGKEPNLVVHIQGRIGANGKLTSVSIDGSAASVHRCIRAALSQLKFEEGGSKIFKMHIFQHGSPGYKTKSFVIPPKGPKKFQ